MLTAAQAHGFEAEPVESTGDDELRLLLRERQTPAPGADDGRLARPSCHHAPAPEGGLHDDLAAQGLYLFVLRRQVTRRERRCGSNCRTWGKYHVCSACWR